MTARILWRCSNEKCRRSLGVRVDTPRPSVLCGPCEEARVDGWNVGNEAGRLAGRRTVAVGIGAAAVGVSLLWLVAWVVHF